MIFDTLDTLCSLSSVCFPIAQIVSKNVPYLLPMILLSPLDTQICIFIFPFLFSFHFSPLSLLFFLQLPLVYLFPLIAIRCKITTILKKFFYEIKTKYKFESVVCWVYLFSIYFLTSCRTFSIYCFSTHTHTHTHTHLYIYIYIYIYI